MWRRPLLRLLLRDPGEIARRARGFAIRSEHGRDLVGRLGEAFIAGYNAMLSLETPADVAGRGRGIDPHMRPFFFEGAAMGYLPRGYLSPRFRRRRVERDLLAMDARFRYLYYVGLGFWFAVRHPRRPSALQRLEPHLDPMFLPLCHDGFGFKLGFFDFPGHPAARNVLERVPPRYKDAAYQGFGRALFFVYMDDEEGFRQAQRYGGGVHRHELEFGRSLALAFTGVDRPDAIVRHLTSASDPMDQAARLTGVTWAFTAREMTDPAYFRDCLADAPRPWQELFRRMPALCDAALKQASDYADWQQRTAAAVVAAGRAIPLAAARA